MKGNLSDHHEDLPGSDSVILVTDNRVLSFWSRRLRMAWDLPFSTLRAVSKESAGVLFRVKGQDRFVVIEDETTRNNFYVTLSSVINAYSAKHKQVR